MDFVNKFYVKIDKEKLKSCFHCDDSSYVTVYELLNIVSEYEKDNNVVVDSFYVSMLSNYYRDLSDIFDFSIKKDILINAYIQACILDDNDKNGLLIDYIIKKELNFNDNPDLFNYVLDHSMDVDEFLNGQTKKLVLNNKTKLLEMDYIYNNFKNNKKIS